MLNARRASAATLGFEGTADPPAAAVQRGPVIFLHIPKTGGTSLRQVILQAYPPGCCQLIYYLEPGRVIAAGKTLSNGGAVYGHLYFGVHELLGVAPRYVTMVREPVSRVASFYRQQARDPESEHFHDIAAGMTMVDLLESGCHQVN